MTIRQAICWLFTLAVSLAGVNAGADPTPGATEVLGPFTGHYAPLHPDNLKPTPIAYYGTDLGWSYEHKGKLEFLFGDTNAREDGAPAEASTGRALDDSYGSIDLAEWPDPAAIRPGHIPLVKLGQNPGTDEVAAIDPGQPMESFKTTVGGFSNGEREFAIFYSSKPVGCQSDRDCPNQLSCDTTLGYFGVPYTNKAEITFACRDGAPYCTADTMRDASGKPVAGSGFCSDRTSSVWADSDIGRSSATALTQLVGLRDTAVPKKYGDIHEWVTTKFSNPAFRTVQDFEPGRTRQDYRSASLTGSHRRVFIWGRPGFIGVGATGRSLGLYFAYVDMPAGPGFDWTLHYFTGTDANGVPQFSTSERDAAAVDLDATRPGVQPEEAIDVVNQMSIAWVGSLGKWVMFYGGGVGRLPTPDLPHCGLLEFFTQGECEQVVVGNGAIRMRTADNPWGPWTPPRDVIVGGDPDARPLAGQYAPGGVFFHPDCRAANCETQTHAIGLPDRDYGFFYAANIIEQWIKPVPGGVDLIWNVSTWDPYRIVLMRTHINR